MVYRFSILFLLFSIGLLFAQNSRVTGKIAGQVIDKDSGEPIIGANVFLEDTYLGASTDEEGYYVILNVPASDYTVVFSYVGYNVQKVEGVTVRPDYTTTVDAAMSSEVIEGEVVVVTAEKPVVQNEITASVKEVSATEIRHSAVSNFTQIVAQQIGAVETGRGRRSGGIHIRGGRNNEIVFYVDGVNSNDPFVGAAGINIDNNAIEQLNIISGGFNAEYGESMSGVVQIITKSGNTERYGLSAEVTSDAPFANTDYDWGYNKYYGSFTGPIPGLRKQKASFRGDIQYLSEDDRTPSIIPQDHNDRQRLNGSLKLGFEPVPSKLRLQLIGRFTETEENLYSHSRSANPFWLDQTYRRNTGDNRISLTLSHTLSQYSWYDVTLVRFENYNNYAAQNNTRFDEWRVVDRYLPWVDYAEDEGWYNRHTGEFTGITEEEAFYYYYENIANGGNGFVTRNNDGTWEWNSLEAQQEAYNNRYYNTGTWEIENGQLVFREFDIDNYLLYLSDPDNEAYQQYNYTGDIDDFYPGSNDILGNFDLDFVPRWHDHTNSYVQGELAFSSQLNKENLIKVGGWARQYDLDYTDIQFLNTKPYFDSYTKKPLEVAAYAQNKFEFEDLVINAGLRYDYWDPDSENPVDLRNLDLGFEETKAKAQFSPRLGISFAASEKMSMYVHYGKFFQRPNLSDLFQNLNADITNGVPLLGNPDLPAQEETAYEAGFQREVAEGTSLKFSAYYKDVSNLLSTDIVNTISDGNIASYTIYQINDFSKIKGFEVELKKRMSPGMSGTLTYSFLDAKGTGSDDRDFYYLFLGTDSELPRKEYPLDFDITHDIKARLNYLFVRDTGPEFMGFKPLSDLNINVYANWHTGAAYTPVDFRGNPLERGSGRMPSLFNVDLRLDKYFHPYENIELNFFVDVRNLFDVRNVVQVYTRTGEPDDNGNRPIWDPENTGAYSAYERWGYESEFDMYLADVEGWERRVKVPSFYTNPRIIRTGLMIKF